MAYTPILTPVFGYPIRPPAVALPAAVYAASTGTVASLISARGAAIGGGAFYADKRTSFSELRIHPVGANAIAAGKLYLLEYDGTNFREVASVAHVSQGAPTTTTAPTDILFPQYTADKPLMLMEGLELVIATAVAQPAGALMAVLSAGRMF